MTIGGRPPPTTVSQTRLDDTAMLAAVDARIQVLQASIAAALPNNFVPAGTARRVGYTPATVAPLPGSSRLRESTSPERGSDSRMSLRARAIEREQRRDRAIEREQRHDRYRAARLYATVRAASRTRQMNMEVVLQAHHPASAMNRVRGRAVARPDPATVTKSGWRRPRAKSLTQTDLWQQGVGPDDQSHSANNEHHMCGVCHFVKSHPVSFVLYF